MTTNYYPEIKEWHVPKDLLRVAVAEMENDGRYGNEGTCLWLGTKQDSTAEITHSVLLRGRRILKSPAQIRIDPELMREVHCAARDLGLVLVGQIHSHGKQFGVGLSPVDRALGFRIPSFLSVVAPNYGLTWPISWPDCGVHIFLRNTGFARLSATDITHRIVETAIDTVELTIGTDG